MKGLTMTIGTLLTRLQVALIRWPWLSAAPFLLALAAAALGSLEADARVGGGQSYSSGSSGRSSGGGSSGGGGGGDAAGLLIWLLFEHPMIGIPVVIVVLAVVIYQNKQQSGGGYTTVQQGSSPSAYTGSRPVKPPRERLTELDPGFSETLFIDFFQRVYTTARQLAPQGATDSLRPWMTAGAIAQVQQSSPVRVDEVIFGSTRLSDVQVEGKRSQVEVVCEVNLLGTDSTGTSRQWLRHEVWTLGRRTGVHSPGPERMRVLCCASCGSPEEPKLDGTCPSCGNLRTGGETQWEVEGLRVVLDRPLPTVELHLGGGVEPGTRRATIFDPELAVAKRGFINRHPDFSWTDFDARVRHVFLKLQESWSARRLEDARAFQTDALFQVHRFWMARYIQGGLFNRMSGIAVDKVEVARVTRDAWFETVTVRVFARMCDWTERESDGSVVGGSKSAPRVFSEYWTFVRTIGAAAKGVDHDLDACPSCGAPLDQVSMAGVCGYCDSKITGGDFDWVLSRIEQDEAYRG
jgi:predicted lipid-binding transport protein (Tim44 family)